MAGKFLKRAAIIDTIKSEQYANARRKRMGLTRHPVMGFACGCSDDSCGAFHMVMTDRTIPTTKECADLIRENNWLKRRFQRLNKR